MNLSWMLSGNHPKFSEKLHVAKILNISVSLYLASFSCKGLSDGIYRHPKDCSNFFHCRNDKSYVKSCPPGLKFNPANKFCDWPQNVKC